MKVLLRAIFRAIRRAMRAAARAVREVVQGMDGFLTGLFAGGYVDETEDNEPILVEDAAARQETSEAVSRPSASVRHPADLVARAVELRSGSQKFDDVFDVSDPSERRLHAFVAALDECGLRAIRYMPRHTLESHVEGGEFCAAGLRPIDRTIADARARATAVSTSEAMPRRRLRSSPTLDLVRSEGRKLTLGEVVASTRRAAAARR